MAAADENFDPHYEYDAPKYFDFAAAPSDSTRSPWWKGQQGHPHSNPNDIPEALAEVSNKAKRTNIVTSWGHIKGNAPNGGTTGQPAATKAVHASQPKEPKETQARPRTRSEHAAAAAAAKKAAEGRKKSGTTKELKVGANVMKAKKIKMSTAGLVKMLKSKRHMPTRSTKQLTVPDDVVLHTSRRAGAHANKSATDGDMQVERMDDDDDGDDDTEASPYKPLTLRVKEANKTPGRFKKQPDAPAPVKPLAITKPKEPKLHTTKRSRPNTFKSREEEEAELMASMPVFKASTLNPLVLTASGKIGVPTVEKRELTEQQPFHFITDDRAEARAARLQRQEQSAEAGPSQPQAAATGASERDGDRSERGLPAKARKSVAPQLTEARSPMLRTKFRVRESRADEPRHEFRARPVPKYISVPSLDLSGLHEAPAPTQPEPFHLATEQRGTQYRQALAAKLAAEEEEARKARIPRAQGLPLSTDMPMKPPKPEPRKLTLFEPFVLQSEARHQEYAEQRRRELEAEEAAKREAAEFKARPMWNGIPYRLHDVDVPLTVPEEVPLRTKERASTREEFNKAMEEKQRQAELAAQLAAEEAQRREEEERRQLRKAAQFKARPMPDLSVVETFKPPPPKPTTKAMSPCLGRNKRRKSGHH